MYCYKLKVWGNFDYLRITIFDKNLYKNQVDIH